MCCTSAPVSQNDKYVETSICSVLLISAKQQQSATWRTIQATLRRLADLVTVAIERMFTWFHVVRRDPSQSPLVLAL